VSSNGICRGFAFKYGKFLLAPRFLTALSVPKVPTRVQQRNIILGVKVSSRMAVEFL